MVIRGCAGAVGVLALPFLLANALPSDQMKAWTIVIGLTGAVRSLDFGVSTAVVRFLASEPDRQKKDQILRAGSRMLIGPAVVAGTCLILLAVRFSYFYPALKRAKHVQETLAVLGIFAAAGLVLFPVSSFFLAGHRGKFLAKTLILSKFLQLSAIFFCLRFTTDILILGLLFGVTEFGSGVFLWVSYRKEIPRARGRASRQFRMAMWRQCGASAVWGLSSVFIASFDTAIVGRVDPEALVEYGLSLAVAATIGGLHSALLSPVTAELSTPFETANLGPPSKSPEYKGTYVVKVARQTNFLLGIVTLILLFLTPLVTRFSGNPNETRMAGILIVLNTANYIRMLANPYAVSLVATGEHRKVVLSPLLEAGTNFVASVLLGIWFGAIGVAFGTLLGAIVSLSFHLFHNMPRTISIQIDPRVYIRKSAAPNLAPVLLGSLVAFYLFA
jgi:O-antigen/teichoic acid export membrane protein